VLKPVFVTVWEEIRAQIDVDRFQSGSRIAISKPINREPEL
jgi:hypothetical protein